MFKTIGACGYIATGSSAICDLLKEFDEFCVLDDFEMMLAYYPDGLCDLDWHLNVKSAKECGMVAISRFRKLVRNKLFMRHIKKRKQLIQLSDEFINSIVRLRWRGLAIEDGGDYAWHLRWFIGAIVRKVAKTLKIKVPTIYQYIAGHERELVNCPQNFEQAAREYITAFLDSQGRVSDKITVLNQPFPGNNPSIAFKYFDAPAAIIVDRDPRDCYLFAREYLRNRGAGLQIACENVHHFIDWYKTIRGSPGVDPEYNMNVLHIHFEELIYDYEKAVQKVAEFCGVHEWNHKGEFFKPSWSRNNTQLFKQYKGYESDIAIITKELKEYIFPFDDYPDVEAEGHMFSGSQAKRG
jgi:hypothetical protein